MSFDIYASCHHCGATHFDWSPTYNYGPMFVALGIHPKDFNGKPPLVYAKALADALAKLNADLPAYQAMEPENKWGTAAELRNCLPDMIRALEGCPEGSVIKC